ncbi:hypothetical protein, partial [Nocardia heshunensis]
MSGMPPRPQPPEPISNVDTVYYSIRDNWKPAAFFHQLGSYGFTNTQIKDALDKLLNLSPEELKEAWKKLYNTDAWDDPKSFKQDFLDAAKGAQLADDPKYRDFIVAVKNNAVDAYCNELSAAPQFSAYGFEPTDGKGQVDAVDTRLFRPKGASRPLRALIANTEFMMWWDVNTLGLRDPQAVPDFITELAGLQITEANGWSKVRDASIDLQSQLQSQQEAYIQAHQDIAHTTYDATKTSSDLFNNLVKIKDRLNDQLKYEPPTTAQESNQIMESTGGSALSAMNVVLYQGDADVTSSDFGKYTLTPDAEQRYYIAPLETAAAAWDTAYAAAAKTIQEGANNPPKGPATPGGPGATPGGPGATPGGPGA